MDVLLAVARIAIGRSHDLRGVPRHMAGVTIEIAMRPGERVAGLGVVIKGPRLPAMRVVTEPAIRAEASFVMLVGMAGDASQWRLLELGRAMTRLAAYRGMPADQREAGDVMIEGDDPPP